MRRVESCNRWFLSHGTRSLSFIFTIPVAVYDISRSHRHSNALCPRNLYLYTTLACCRPLIVLLPFASAHSTTYYYAFLPGTGPLPDSTLCTALASGVLVRSLGALFGSIYVQNVEPIRVASISPRISIKSVDRLLCTRRT